jgi:hypothetical protein
MRLLRSLSTALITECKPFRHKEQSTTDYERVSDDGIFVKSLRDSYKLLMRRLQTNYLKQKIYRATLHKGDETAVHDATSGDNYYKQEENNKVFSEQLEAQRHEIVETVEDINDIGGASISSEMRIFAA